jgi:Flp pilus assembly protein TadG
MDRGSATLEIAVLGPAILLLIFTVVQAGLWFYARSLALAAAQSGVAAGRAYGAAPSDANLRAQAFLADQAGDSLTNPTVSTAGSTATSVRVEVSGRCLAVLPGLSLAVRQSAVADRERFTTLTESQP